MTREEAGKLILLLRATYHNVKLDNVAATVDAWHLALLDAPYDLMERAAAAWIGTEHWFPTPADLRMLAIDQSGYLPNGSEAWALVLGHIRGTRAGSGLAFAGHPAISEAVRSLGGWGVLRASEQPGRDREAFLRSYETYRTRAARDIDMGSATALDGPTESLPAAIARRAS